MTQETAYQSLTFGMRESLHERVGLLIESSDPERLGQYVDVLAHHYGRTQRVDKQRVWFRAAGDAAKTAFANDTAVDYYRRLLPLLPEAETGEVLIELGGVWQLTGEWAEAERAYRRAMEVATAAGRPGILAAGERDLGDLFMYNRSHAEAVTWLRRAADGFDRLGDAAGLSRTLESLAFALYRQGAYAEALAIAERHRTLAAAAGDLAGVSIALNITASCSWRPATPWRRANCSRRRWTRRRGPTTGSACSTRPTTWPCCTCATVSTGPPSRTACERSRSRRRSGYRQTAGVVVGNLGEVYRDEGDHVPATRCFAYALRIALDLRDWTTIGDQVANLAATAAAQGRARGGGAALRPGGRDRPAPRRPVPALRLAAPAGEAPRRAGPVRRGGAAEPGSARDRRDPRRAGPPDPRLRPRAAPARRGRCRASGRVDRPPARAGGRVHRAVTSGRWSSRPSGASTRRRRTPGPPPRTCTGTCTSGRRCVEYRAAHAFLTGVTLPPGPPLPPLPAPLDTDAADVAELLRRVDRITPAAHGRPSARLRPATWPEPVPASRPSSEREGANA